tara:strand:+ start:14457 stop:17639 length:3183 start_codon:yes stop_codon:yes gene_type:complete
MKAIIFFILFTMLTIPSVFGQIKIGDNPQNIDPASVLELESSSKVLVITRVSAIEMEAITPQRGGIVYNTDTECINYYDGTQWINLCDAVNFTITNDPIINNRATIEITQTESGYNLEIAKDGILGDNIVDGGIGPDDIQDNSITQDKLAAESVGSSEIRQNAVGSDEIRDGSIAPTDMANFIPGQVLTTDENGIVRWGDAGDLMGAVGDEITITGSGTPANPLVLTEGVQLNISNNTALIEAHIADDQDTDDTNELIDLTFTKLTNTLSISQSATPVGATVDLSNLVGSDDQQLSLVNNILTLEEGGTPIDLTTYVSSDNQNLGTATLANEQLTINIQNGNPTTANLSALATDVALNTGLALKENLANKSNNVALGNSNVLYPTQNAVKVYVDNVVGGSAQTIVSEEPNNSISPSLIDGGALYNDPDNFIGNEVIGSSDGTLILNGNGNTIPLTLDVSVGGIGTVELANNAVTNAKLANNSVQSVNIVNGTIATVDIAPAAAAPANTQVLTTSTTGVVNWIDLPTGGTGDIPLNNGNILIGNTLNVAAPSFMSKDATMNNLGEVTITNSAVTPIKIEPSIINGQVLTTTATGVQWQAPTGTTQNASQVPFTPYSTITATNTQLAVAQLKDELDAATIAGGGENPTNELQDIQLAGTVVSLTIPATVGNSIDLDPTFVTEAELLALSVNDADFDPANEIELPTGGNNGQVLSTDGAGTYAWVDDQSTAGTIISTDAGNLINPGTDTGALLTQAGLDATFATDAELAALSVNDADFDPTNEIELPTGGNNGQVLSTDGAGTYAWVTNGGITGNTGSIFFADGITGAPTENNTQLNWDNVQNRLAIGNISPQSKLDVDGQIRARNGFAGNIGSAGNPSYGFYTETTMGMYRAGVSQLAFSTDSQEAMRIDAGQNVGIGTNAIAANTKLHVVGNSRFDGDVLVNGIVTTVPDYVFQKYFLGNSFLKPEYDMPSLLEVENFIKLNHHLPNVPSYLDIEEQGGIIINRTTLTNLEKIEELFLHTIEQEKKIKELESSNKNMATEVEALKAQMEEIKKLVLEKTKE